tara:strand:+ start:771 stop:1685 length:915 start_codon:yes stop_codon:yes gene_type:complete
LSPLCGDKLAREPGVRDKEVEVMAYRATVIPVMIATPGDVSEERDVIRAVIHDWNDVNASASQTMLTPVGWDTHSSPELGVRAQELINTRLLKDCDLLVGVFWTRLGTPTGKAISGTVEEIEEHIAAGKPAMIYFSSKPVAPESVDSAQFSELQKFKDKCKELGLVEFFDDTSQFQQKFSKQLQLCLSKNIYLRRLAESFADPVVSTLSNSPGNTSAIGLTEEAKALLKAAAAKDDGTILKMSYLGGQMIQAGGQQFGGERGRESAKWENALNELINQDLVVPRGYKDQVFELTHQGWAVADNL